MYNGYSFKFYLMLLLQRDYYNIIIWLIYFSRQAKNANYFGNILLKGEKIYTGGKYGIIVSFNLIKIGEIHIYALIAQPYFLKLDPHRVKMPVCILSVLDIDLNESLSWVLLLVSFVGETGNFFFFFLCVCVCVCAHPFFLSSIFSTSFNIPFLIPVFHSSISVYFLCPSVWFAGHSTPSIVFSSHF